LSTRLSTYLKQHFGIHSFHVMARPLRSTGPDTKLEPELTYRLLDRSEIEQCCHRPDLHMGPAFVRDAAARNDVCVGAFHAGAIVGGAWIAFSSAPCADDVWVNFDDRACFVYKVFVRDEWRGRGLERALHVVADNLCLWAGKRFAMSFVDSTNEGDIAQIEQIGARTIAKAGFVEPIRMNWKMRKAGVDGLAFRFFRQGAGQPAQEPLWQEGSRRS
jgi:GNAT superfamily N-acetyltransferase